MKDSKVNVTLDGKETDGGISKEMRLTIGAAFLAFTSLISLFWAWVGFNGILLGYDWFPLAIFGLVAFSVGLAGAIMAIRWKNIVFFMFAACLPVLENSITVKLSFDSYNFTTPWVFIIVAMVFSTLGAIFAGNSE